MEIISRPEAARVGLKYYFTGRSCKHGHLSPRKVCNSTCLECERGYSSKFRSSNREKISNVSKEYYKQRYSSDQTFRKQISQKSKDWRRDNPDKVRSNGRKYYHNNPGKQHERNAKRRAVQFKATPPWFDLERLVIQQLYEKAKLLTTKTNIPHHVDHIIPLQNKKVCGLHCLANLQILTASENISKGNHF